MSFFALAAELVSKVVTSLAIKELGEEIQKAKTQRRMQRLVGDAVDRIVEQAEEYLHSEQVSDARKGILIAAICAKLQPLADDPQRFFAGDLNGALIFKQCHPLGEMPQEIREEQLDQFYTVLFPQIAHFLAGSRIALAQWQAEGFREEFKRLREIADEIRQVNAKVADLPGAVVGALADQAGQEAETLLHQFAQTLLSNLLLQIDLSPLRAERALYGTLDNHFVVPALRERLERAETIGQAPGILDALAKPGSRRIVHGGAGTGKTTWSLWLQSRLLQAKPSRLAVVLRLRTVTDLEKRSLLDLLREEAGTHLRDALTDEVLRKWYAAGRLVVVLDGFDEVPEERRDAVENWVKNFSSVVNKTALLVTSRPLQSGHLERLKEPWQQWDLLPFDEPRIFEFIERWHRHLPEGELSAKDREVEPATLARTFFNDPSLRPLADTPLMLGTLLFVHHRDKKLPSGRVDLYERYIAAMLGLRDTGLGIQARATKLTDKDKRRVLAHIALHFHLNSVNEVNDDTMRQLITEVLAKFKFDEEAERLLPALCERTGLLQGPGTWSFMHKTIGEFLVAELICNGNTYLPDKRRLDRQELWVHRHEDAWTAVMFFWAGKTTEHELEEFIRDLTKEDGDQESLLTLSLLDDQGDRLAPETQRELAVRLIGKPLPNESHSDLHSYIVCATPDVPGFAYQEYQVPYIQLRGLSTEDSAGALMRLFVRGVLVPEDIHACEETCRAALTIAAIRALRRAGSPVTLDLRHYVKHLPPCDSALYFFHHYMVLDTDVEQAQTRLAEWLEAFPEGRPWVPLLLAGSVTQSFKKVGVSNAKQTVGCILWQWRDEHIAEDWLKGSGDCISWSKPVGYDLLEKTRQSLEDDGASAWGLTAEQHADLLAWCFRMMSKRAKLKAAEK